MRRKNDLLADRQWPGWGEVHVQFIIVSSLLLYMLDIPLNKNVKKWSANIYKIKIHSNYNTKGEEE